MKNHEQENNQTSLSILEPNTLLTSMTSLEIASAYSSLLDQVYGNRSDRLDGHSVEKFKKRLEEGILYPFLVFDKDKPVACYAVQWYGEQVDMGNAAVLPEYRDTGLVKGKEIYLKAYEWTLKNLGNKTAIIMGGSRIPTSAAIAINSCNRFPCWLSPFASWGYNSEPLEENNNRVHEFLLVSESYPQGGAYTPDNVSLPNDPIVAKQIEQLWQRFSAWNQSINRIHFQSPTEELFIPTFNFSKGDSEEVRFEYNGQSNIKALPFENMLEYGFSGYHNLSIPKTRGIAVDVVCDAPHSSEIQSFLLENGFVFFWNLPRYITY